MRVPLSWLSDHVDVRLDAEALAERLTLGGLEVEAILRPTAGVRGVVVAEVRAVQPVPASDKLVLVDVFDGQRDWEIVCGASNFAVGDRVPAALPGARLPGGVEIGVKRLRGVTSNGMLASARELGVGEDHRGIWVLDRSLPVGADLGELLDLDDAVLEIAVTPDRGYALSISGVARDVAALTGADLKPPSPLAAAVPATDEGITAVEIADGARCHRFTATEVRGVRLAASPAWLQRRLAAAGMRPLVNVVDATNYAMLDTGQPIHAYDRARLAGPLLAVRDAEPGETLLTLDGIQRRLDPDDLVIADAGGVIGLAGIMGGETTEVGPETTDLVVEAASFSETAVLRTARRHKLFTEASTRFEKVVPDATVAAGSDRCIALLVEVAGGTPVGRRDVAPAPRERVEITMRPERIRALLGLDLPDDRQAELLRRLGCDVEGAGRTRRVLPPPSRPDLTGEADLAEEIARIHGYDAVPQSLPPPVQAGGWLPADQARRAVRSALAGAGWTEVLTFPFIADEDVDALGLPEGDRRRTTVALENPLSKEEAVLRTSLLPGLFRVARHNVNRQTPDLALFEVGRVFLPPATGEPGAHGGPDEVALPAEPLMLGLTATGAFTPRRWDAQSRQADLGDILGAADLVRRVVRLPALEPVPTEERPYHPGRAARLRSEGTDVGVVGELHPRVAAAFGLPPRTLAGELRLDVLTARGILDVTLPVPSALPSVWVDVAVVVGEQVPAAAVEAAVRAAAGRMLTECTLFDVYRGASIGEGRKSLAYRLRLDDPERQLTDADAQSVINAVDAAVADRLGGSLRR